ncbi:unnamed protein product [Notodromas monacha]|uniref:Uncharacterized protein n=1 Tax=Notodromas monacha TaxID=399045 RepID=A0A7R9BFI2_9CRUS|nr:unnamed protein product [Notodromas monacha]CAG0913703.1 unnamed protein product [Notodromas monacha]
MIDWRGLSECECVIWCRVRRPAPTRRGGIELFVVGGGGINEWSLRGGLNDDFGTSSPLGEGSMGWGPVDHIGYLLEGPNSNNAHEDDEGKCKNTGLDCDPTSDDQISMFHTIAFGLDDKSDDASGLSSSKLDSDGDVVFKDKMMSEATIESTLQMLQTSVANWGSTVTSSASSPTLSLPSLMALPSVSKPNSAAAASQAASVSDVSCQLTSNADTTETTISNPSVFRLPIKQEHSYSLLISQTPGSRSQCGERIIIRRNPEKQVSCLLLFMFVKILVRVIILDGSKWAHSLPIDITSSFDHSVENR